METMIFWHGGDLSDINNTFKQQTKKQEYGPGLYLTTSYEVVKKYIKGSRKLYRVEVALGNSLERKDIPYDNVLEFLYKLPRSISIKLKDKFDEYNKNGFVSAEIINNVFVNNNLLKPEISYKLKEFYLKNNIDYSLVVNAFGWGEDMMILFNTNKIINVERIGPKDKIDKYELHKEGIEVSKKDLENQKLISQAHKDITRTKGKDYAPDVHEIQKWINNPKKLKEDAEDATFIGEISKGELEEEKKKKADRCLRIARSKMPQTSAYRSGNIVRCRQGKIWKGLKEDEDETLDEKWSQKYKKSIDCNNPKGFSQKAHCKGRLKEEDFLDEKTDFSKEKEQGLHGWFARQGGKGKSKGWVDCNTCRDGKCKSCGRKEGESRSKYPACRPTPSACKTRGKGKSWGKKSKLSEQDYSNYNTSVISLFHNGKVLILQRGSTAPWMPNKWSIVGGVVDEGEDFKETVIRETNEEIGQSPINVKYIKQVMTQDSGNIIYYIGDLNSDEINLDYENQDYRFITENEIENFQFVPHVVDFIEESFRIKRSKTNEEFPIQSLYREKENMEIKKKDIFDEDLVLKRDQSKKAIYVQSDLDSDKAKSQETFKNKEALKSAGFKWDGDIKSWKTDDVNFMLAKKTIETINKKEYLINQLEELEEIIASSEDTPEKPTLMSKIDMYINDLASATDEASVSAEIRRYLTFFSKFRTRSVINTWLIYIQSGGKATKVAGFRKWEKLFHRRVKKGAKGYQIFVPLDKKITQKDDETGEEITTGNVTRFGVGYVFDISQTEPIDERGEIPETPKWYADLEPTERSIELYKYFIELCEDMGIEISKSDSERGEKGYSAGNKINISSAREGAGEVATLVHEIAHELMHWKKSSIYYQENTNAELRELQAESVSYVVLKNYDLPTEHHSTYLALWKANNDKIKDNLKVISSVAAFIISEIDKIEKRNQKNEVINEQVFKDVKNIFKRLLK